MGCFATTQQEPVNKRGVRTGDGDNNSLDFGLVPQEKCHSGGHPDWLNGVPGDTGRAP